MSDRFEEKEKTPVLITISNKDIDRIYWRFLLNSLLLSVLVSVAGFCLLIITAIFTMKYDTRPIRTAVEPTSIVPTSSEPTPNVTTTQTTEPAPIVTTSQTNESTPNSNADCVEKMQSGQIEAYNECVKNK
jgi:hypothetical protein